MEKELSFLVDWHTGFVVECKRAAAGPSAAYGRRWAGDWVMTMPETTYGRIYAVVSAIPEGLVATYGQVARLAGMPGQARLVGYALSSLQDRVPIPWHRVVNAGGRISPRSGGRQADAVQRLRLESEGVSFDEYGRIPLDRFQWQPAGSEGSGDAERRGVRDGRKSTV